MAGGRRLEVGARVAVLAAVLGAALFAVQGVASAQADDEYTFEIIEENAAYLGPSGPQIYVRIRTVQQYPCYNYVLPAIAEQEGDIYRVRLGPVVEPGECQPAVGPAAARVALDLPLGAWRFQVASGDRTDQYSVFVTGATIEVQPDHGRFTRPTATVVQRFPPDSFAYLCADLDQNDRFCEGFERELRNLEVFAYPVPEDVRNPFQILAPGAGSPPVTVYQYRNAATWAHIAALVEDYVRAADHICGRTIEVVNWQAERALSWQTRPATAAECEGVVITPATPQPPPPSNSPPPPTAPVPTPREFDAGTGEVPRWVWYTGGVLLAASLGYAWLALRPGRAATPEPREGSADDTSTGPDRGS